VKTASLDRYKPCYELLEPRPAELSDC